MKKIVITSLLILTMSSGFTGNINFVKNAGVIQAEAATIRKKNLATPKVASVKKTGNKVKLSIKKVPGATCYKVYRATALKGKYTLVATTKKNVYTDKVNSKKNYFYKVQALSEVGKKIKGSSKVSAAKPTPTKVTKPTKSPTPTKTPEQVTAAKQTDFAKEVLRLVNVERSKAGLQALSTTSALQNAADKRAKEIVSSFSHTRPNGTSFTTVLKEYSISYRAAGENIAWGQKTPAQVMDAWMNSSGHRANILGSQFGKVGIGVYKDAKGVYYWTQVFTN